MKTAYVTAVIVMIFHGVWKINGIEYQNSILKYGTHYKMCLYNKSVFYEMESDDDLVDMPDSINATWIGLCTDRGNYKVGNRENIDTDHWSKMPDMNYMNIMNELGHNRGKAYPLYYEGKFWFEKTCVKMK